MPALKKLDEKKSQSSIRNYFQCQQVISNAPISVSKRVRSAINRMGVQHKDTDMDTSSVNIAEKSAKPKRQRKTPKSVGDCGDNAAVNLNSDTVSAVDKPKSRTTRRTRQSQKQNEQEDNVVNVAATDEACSSKKIPKIPDQNPPIRQRIKELERLEANKQKAIELLKKKKK